MEQQALFGDHLKARKYFYDMIELLNLFEKFKIIHGNIRPELIYYDQDTDNFVLCDSLRSKGTPAQIQSQNIQSNLGIFLSQKSYLRIVDKQTSQINFFKEDLIAIFSIFVLFAGQEML